MHAHLFAERARLGKERLRLFAVASLRAVEQHACIPVTHPGLVDTVR